MKKKNEVMRMRPLFGDRIRLVLVEIEDTQEIFECLSKQKITNLAFFVDEEFTVERQRAYLRRIIDSPTDYLFLVRREYDNTLIGTMGLHEHDIYHRNTRYGGKIFPDYERQGYGTEAMTLVLSFAFQELEVNKVYINIFTTNDVMRKFCAKLGFKNDGILREHYLLRGEYYDMFHFTLLKREWADN